MLDVAQTHQHLADLGHTPATDDAPVREALLTIPSAVAATQVQRQRPGLLHRHIEGTEQRNSAYLAAKWVCDNMTPTGA